MIRSEHLKKIGYALSGASLLLIPVNAQGAALLLLSGFSLSILVSTQSQPQRTPIPVKAEPRRDPLRGKRRF